MGKLIKTEVTDSIFIVTLNRPSKKNAMSRQMRIELLNAVIEFEQDQNLLAMILTNESDCFCAGSDLKEINDGTYEPEGRNLDGFGIVTGRYLSKPVIIAVNGKCIGGGAEMLLAADLAVVSNDCVISLPEIKQGLLAAGGGGLLRLGKSIPIKLAMELALTGDPIDAKTALSWGLVNRVVGNKVVLKEAISLAKKIICNAPIAVRRTKYLFYNSLNKSWLRENDGWIEMLEADELIKETDDAKEGAKAFTEKRLPCWSNR